MGSRVRTGRSAPLQEVAADKLRVVSAWLRDYITAIKNGSFHPFTAIERKAREATRNEPWGPTGTTLKELADASCSSTDCEIIFAVIQLRLNYPPEKWRNVYKALIVLDYLLLRGSEQSVQITREELLSRLADLENFSSLSAEGKDQGINVRHRAKAVRELMADEPRLCADRLALHRQRRAYQGFTRDQLAGGKPFHDDQDIPTPTSALAGGLRRTLSDSSMQGSKHPRESSSDLDGFAPACRSGLKNAGETKGVTMEMNKKQLAELKSLLDRPENRYCADCQGGGGAARASWASINNGVFLCLRCAGVHRGLGTHVSKVRSCTLDTWLPEQVDFMRRTGNSHANAYFEAKLDPDLKPGYASVDLEPFIRRKYAVKAYADGSWPPASALPGASLRPTSNEEEPTHAEAGDDDRLVAQRSQPRLQGRAASRQHSGHQAGSKPLGRLVSVPLPAAPPQTNAQPPVVRGGGTQPDLMAFGPDEHAAHSASGERQDGANAADAFAGLDMLQPVSLLDDSGSLDYGRMHAPVLSGSNAAVVPAHVARIGGTSAAVAPTLTNGHSVGISPPVSAAPPSPSAARWPAQHAADGFSHTESVHDWGHHPEEAPKPRLQRLHVRAGSIGGDSEPGSRASSVFLTPRFTALHGPGPSGAAPRFHQPAHAKYQPPGLARPGASSTSALAQSTKQWAANAKQGERGVLDELVLHAMADLPPPPRTGPSMQEILALSRAPRQPSMLEQRATPLRQLTT